MNARVSNNSKIKGMGTGRVRNFLRPFFIASALVIASIGLMCWPAPSNAGSSDFDLQKYRGKVVYLDFWASWCGPCKQSFPYMSNLQARYRQKGLAVVAVNLDHDPALADKFLRSVGINDLEIIYDTERQLPKTYGVKDMPTAVLIGRDGKVRFTHAGFFPENQSAYTAHVVELINEK